MAEPNDASAITTRAGGTMKSRSEPACRAPAGGCARTAPRRAAAAGAAPPRLRYRAGRPLSQKHRAGRKSAGPGWRWRRRPGGRWPGGPPAAPARRRMPHRRQAGDTLGERRGERGMQHQFGCELEMLLGLARGGIGGDDPSPKTISHAERSLWGEDPTFYRRRPGLDAPGRAQTCITLRRDCNDDCRSCSPRCSRSPWAG